MFNIVIFTLSPSEFNFYTDHERVWILRCGGQLLNVHCSFQTARCIRWPGIALIRVSCLCVIDVMLLNCVCCSRLIRTRITVCSVIFHERLPESSTYPSCGRAHSLEFKVSRCWTCQFVRCFLPAQLRMWNNLLYTLSLTPERWMG